MANDAALCDRVTDDCRSEEELDPITLHNQALIHMEEDPTTGFRKLNFLLQNPPFPPETFCTVQRCVSCCVHVDHCPLVVSLHGCISHIRARIPLSQATFCCCT